MQKYEKMLDNYKIFRIFLVILQKILFLEL